MARNCEKHFVGLNRVFLEEQWQRDKEQNRPPLHTLKTADDVRKWIPSIKKDLNYYLNQLSGVRKHSYQEGKLKEFEEKVKKLEFEHKRFVKKVFELDPMQQGIPWEPKGYVSKNKRKSTESNSTGTCSSSLSAATDTNEENKSCPEKKKKKIVLNVLKNEKTGDG